MYVELKEVKKTFPQVVEIEQYVDSLKEPLVIFRNYYEPSSPPCFEKGVETFDFQASPRPAEDVKRAFGTKRNVPGMNVINAIRAALGAGGYALHISDGSYTEYSIWELKEFLTNFDSTDLKVWIEEVFDCDDFAQVVQGKVNEFFPGIAFGTIWYGSTDPRANWGHAVNIFYSNPDNQVYLLEPQADTFYKFNTTLWKPWVVML